jgi:hypothetical protein
MERIFQYPSNSSWSDRGLIPTVPTPQGWMLQSPDVFIRGFNASEQQFSTLEPLGLIATIPTPQGWMQQQPNAEIFITQFNSSQQQFSTTPGIIGYIIAAAFITEEDDALLASVTVSGAPIPVPIFSTAGQNYDRMQVLGFSSSQTLLYDEPETQAFYILNRLPPSSVQQVSPLFARNWLLTTPNITWVYNPFGSNTTAPLSNEL